MHKMKVLKLCFYQCLCCWFTSFSLRIFWMYFNMFQTKKTLNLILVSMYYCQVGLVKLKVGRIF